MYLIVSKLFVCVCSDVPELGARFVSHHTLVGDTTLYESVRVALFVFRVFRDFIEPSFQRQSTATAALLDVLRGCRCPTVTCATHAQLFLPRGTLPARLWKGRISASRIA